MIVTPFALVGLLIGLYLLLRGSTLDMFVLFLATTLFGGSAALIFVALGGSSVPPAQFVLLFLAARILLPGRQQMVSLRHGIWDNRFLVIFCAYGVISAFALPILFARTMSVTPLKPIPGADLYAVAPLALSGQNVTTAIYLAGTLMAGIGARVAMQRHGAALTFVRAAIWISIAHAMLGIASVALAGTGGEALLDAFRNGHYAQLNQSFDGLVRMNGVWPEPSGFAAYGAVWCILMFELWFRDVLPRRTGPTAMLLAVVLIFSTSSTAYVSLGAYAMYAVLRYSLSFGGLSARKQLWLGAMGLAVTIFALALVVLVPSAADRVWRLVNVMTLAKAESDSGLQRAFWAWQGIQAFLASGGLGIGAGSFRSSSLITSILGSMGVIGISSFTAHLVVSARIFSRRSYAMRLPDLESAVGAAASTTAFVMLAPASVAAPSPDPGLLWGVICGVALALRQTRSSATHARAPFPAATSPEIVTARS